MTGLTDDQALTELLDRRDLVLVTGKGGTGKSTLVAALARMAAKRRGRAVAVDLSAHPRLAELLGPDPGAVEVVNLQVEDVVGPVVQRLLGIAALAGAIARNRVIRQFIQTSPAAREMLLLDELRDRVERYSRERVPVFVDLHATGHAMSFLDTPRSVKRMVRVGPVAQSAEQAERLLLDSARCELVVVALPEELPINETIELVRRAGEIGIRARQVVVNQVPANPIEPHERAILDVLQEHGEGALGGFARTTHGDLQGVDQARVLIERLARSTSARVLEIPRRTDSDPRACVAAMVRELSKGTA